jgi:drug/metabolite transporter (DMT)-like permease
MNARNLAELIGLAAIWGASFLLMRLGAGEFGPVPLSGVRVALAAAALLPVLALRGQWGELRRHWRPIAVVGLVGSALPFLAYSYAALSITAGLSSIFNATTPLWGALIAWLWLHDRPGRSRALGLALGFAGVSWLAWDKAGLRADAPSSAAGAVLACIAATACYGFVANFTKRRLAGVAPMAAAAGSQAAAAVALALPSWWWWPAQTPGATAWVATLALGIVCTGLAYLLYFRLIAHVGPAKAISVTFLIPLFAVFWGWLFLGEGLTPVMVGACAVIVLGTALATGLWTPGARRPR